MTSPYGRRAADRSADAIRKRIGDVVPQIGIVLGSGLGGLASDLDDPVRIPFAEVPGFPTATVAGHAGAIVSGRLSGREVIALAGRFHMYEGHPVQLAAFPVRVMHALGVTTYLVSNAAGGIRRDLSAGDLMIIEDHLNLTGLNPLTGPVEEGDERFPDMSAPYDSELRALLRATAAKVGIGIKEGVYACLPGPSFETRAEVRMLGILGADA
ncbi:MAG TPA: purine-nucleoside phosphorylase, partial [Gemmatimonadaceae bacterium]|nr:purine-nucleoside phosphorylase [Gemmatimonadaceae bacterium]